MSALPVHVQAKCIAARALEIVEECTKGAAKARYDRRAATTAFDRDTCTMRLIAYEKAALRARAVYGRAQSIITDGGAS